MRLKSFGCSFIFGSELADDGRELLFATSSQLTWPAHLARHLGRTYECHARPGSGNLQISEYVLNHAADADANDLFVIGWTWIDRFDYYPANPPQHKRLQPWRTIMPIDCDPTAQVYWRDLHSEYRDKFAALSTIKLVIDTLQQKHIPFVMTYMDRLLFDQRWHTSPAVLDLQSCIKSHMRLFEDQTFLEWSRAHGYPEGAASHPLEQAHRAAADIMIRAFDN